MLDELRQTIIRLERCAPERHRLVNTLAKRHNFYRRELWRVGAASGNPHVMRVLAEDLAFQAQYILGNNRSVEAERKAESAWGRYRNAVRSGEILGLEYDRYAAAKRTFRLLLRDSYYDEAEGADEKTRRYAYALSNAPMPEWFEPNTVLGWLEEMVTASCLVWFAVKDYQEDKRCEK